MATSAKNNDAKNTGGPQQPPLSPQQNSERQNAEAAHQQAEHDIEEDADLSIHSPNDDLDEGETARLGEDENPLI